MRRVFISFLGYSNYGACYYERGDFRSEKVRFIQEATLRYLLTQEQWTEHDVAYIMLTAGAKKVNWLDDGQRTREGEVIHQAGLQTRLQQMSLPMPVETIEELPDGNNDKEIMEIFERVFEKIQEGDRLYFDLTHGFRYLPMLLLVLGNYAKFLRGVTIESITYGNFEGRDKTTDVAQIVDLLSLSALQDWANASSTYLNGGNAKEIKRLADSVVRPILKESRGADQAAFKLNGIVAYLDQVSNEINTCRGK